MVRLFICLLAALCCVKSSAQELQKIAHLPYAPQTLAGCWHYVDSSGGEWGLIGTSDGLSIVDVRDPYHPVKRFMVPGKNNNWREVRTWEGFAYVGSEAIGSGITIVDLRALPDTVIWKIWTGDGPNEGNIISSHTLQAEDGFLYIFGGRTITDGTIIARLDDPWNPVIVGLYTDAYCHDGFIRGDTLWTSEVKKGWFGVVDITDRSQPMLLATQPTPGRVTHNAALNANGTVLFTTDEVAYAPLAAFDVSNLDDIKLLDEYRPSRNPKGEVHNVRVLNDFLINPSYKGQLTIVDATRPDNLIEIGLDSLDKSLVWDADPYLPSGIILATAKFNGLHIYQKPTYNHAAWLEGVVYDGMTGTPLPKVKVFVEGTIHADTSAAAGGYKTGAALSGKYRIRAVKPGYVPSVIDDVILERNRVTQLDIPLFLELPAAANPNAAGFIVTPTVFNHYLRVDFSLDSPFYHSDTMLRLYDMGGKLLEENQLITDRVALLQGLEELPAGGYVLVVSHPQAGIQSIKLLKN
jgi:choice-of-anchor B domain-containing protein